MTEKEIAMFFMGCMVGAVSAIIGAGLAIRRHFTKGEWRLK